MDVDQEMLIGRIGEQTDGALSHRCSTEIGQERRYRAAERRDLGVVDGTPYFVRIGNELAAMHDGGFDAARQPRKTVAPARAGLARVLIEVDRERRGIEASVGCAGFEPEQQLPFDRKRELEVLHQRTRPRARRARGGRDIPLAACRPTRTPSVREPRGDRPVVAKRGAGSARGAECAALHASGRDSRRDDRGQRTS